MKRERAGFQQPRDFPSPWARSDRPVVRRVVRPVEEFVSEEAGSGAVLMVAAIIALVWANVAPGSYDAFWETEAAAGVGDAELHLDLRDIVNDLFMAVFFYVVALEVKREFIFGALRDRAYAALPVAAAFGTMVGAATTYTAINLIGDGNMDGWAIPIATDIAFALAALGLVGRRAPAELRTFLLTLAVVDDLATIAVIAIFYSGGLSLAWLGAAVLALVAVLIMQRIGVRALIPYVGAAAVLWVATHESGIHATIAGVALGLLTPAYSFYPRGATGEAIADQLTTVVSEPDDEVSEAMMSEVSRLSQEAVAPLIRMEHALHPWSAYVILPVFALANAGVELTLDGLGDALTGPVGLGILLGLVVGAPIGGFLFPRIVARVTGATLPGRLDWPAIAAMAPLKGIGFTVAIFIAILAFDDEALQEQATLAILVASLLAGLIGIGSLLLRHRLIDDRPDRARQPD
ncbi:MAG TPA: Na+/H+ antiporter NhaA [Solirubrobacteraceae bacterium]|nr:Na+/H+ antiporter NhaA [Solirubrobacteraceae bacterium]